ncbi:Rec8 like protein-domain-containing protein [Crucibulum laeve]|uniref:Rec8 like protein-domain-containing protein n=1 Tax=Crucibulum laeve TaxID=68775 RepID=A0A5C3MI99_9AGAR|nr:Rec8 like protein-domain-containing protein [Crucibulum laeve]
MFYSETILSRRGPLGKVWLAAHMERKLSKTQTLQTDIEQSVDAIMGQEIEVMALRLSGQLLLGVVRIYSRKAKYLLDDCNEALLKIKMAFRPGVVDMTEDQLVVNKTAITLQAGALDLDLLLPDVNWDMDFEDRPAQPHGHHQAHIDDITLRTADDFQQFDLNDAFDIGPSDGIGSQDFDGVDLGINWEDEQQNGDIRDDDIDQMSIDGSVGVGRDAPDHRDSIDSHILGRNGMDFDMDILSTRSKSRDPSEHNFGDDIDMGFPDLGGVDLGDLGIGFDEPLLDDGQRTPGQTRSPSRHSSPLSEAPATPPPDADLASLTAQPQELIKGKRKHKEKKQIIDSVTELQDGPGAKVGRGRGGGLAAPAAKDVSDIITEQHFLPRSSLVMQLLEIREDPLAHFLPTKVTPLGTYFCAAPPGLAPELNELFLRPIQHSLSNKRRAESPEKGSNKRTRLEGSVQGDDEIEQGRRAESLAPSVAMGSDILGRASLGPDAGFDFADQTGGLEDYQLDVPEFDAGGDYDMDRGKSAAPTDRSRTSTPGLGIEDGEDNYADATCPIALFDLRPSQSQTQTQATDREADTVDTEGKGYSKNTVKALGLIRKELQPTVDEEEEDKVLSFRKMADKASRRAAASFFFELLVLGTRDCVQLQQVAPFENIEVRSKAKLWEQQGHGTLPPSRSTSVAPSRGASVARSVASAIGL